MMHHHYLSELFKMSTRSLWVHSRYFRVHPVGIYIKSLSFCISPAEEVQRKHLSGHRLMPLLCFGVQKYEGAAAELQSAQENVWRAHFPVKQVIVRIMRVAEFYLKQCPHPWKHAGVTTLIKTWLGTCLRIKEVSLSPSLLNVLTASSQSNQ